MNSAAQTDYSSQQQLIAALCDPGSYPHAARNVSVVETHISWVLLAGRYAYKIKKAVDLGFLDFTDLAARRFFCEEEIRLNRRFAPQLYLGVVAIGGHPQQPKIDVSPVIEYAVRMRRFAASRLMDRLLARGMVTSDHIDRLAATIAAFHAGLTPAPSDSAFGTLENIHATARQNFDQLAPLLDAADARILGPLRTASEQEYDSRVPWFEQRRRQGMIRECHGDLHLGNIVIIDDTPMPFDGIEFNPLFRWIDPMNEVAFLVMDLLDHHRADFAFRFLNSYLELSGDYAGVNVLRYYLAYRAMVRAKVVAIRARQPAMLPQAVPHAMDACHAYLRLAQSCLARSRAVLVITHGLPGCGKTTVAQAAAERLRAIRIRSDVERKRLYGLTPPQDSRSQVGSGIYGAEATQRTYARLLELAHGLLDAGFPVIVDAAFLKHEERERFRRLARELAATFVILDIQASADTLRRRILQRQDAATDASEADLAVLHTLRAAQEPLAGEELADALAFINEDGTDHRAAWGALERLAATPD